MPILARRKSSIPGGQHGFHSGEIGPVEEAGDSTFDYSKEDEYESTALKHTWIVGLCSGLGKYLTAENFGHKINMTGIAMRKKQQWTLIPEFRDGVFAKHEYSPQTQTQTMTTTASDTKSGENAHGYYPIVYIRSPVNRFLTLDKFGNVTCETEKMGESQRFALINTDDIFPTTCEKENKHGNASQTWGPCLIYNIKHAYFLSSHCVDNGLQGFNKPDTARAGDFWSCHLHIHPPHINIMHVHRQKFIRYLRDMDCVNLLDSGLPWGLEALFTIDRVPYYSENVASTHSSKEVSLEPSNQQSPNSLQQNRKGSSPKISGAHLITPINSEPLPTRYCIRTSNGCLVTSTGKCIKPKTISSSSLNVLNKNGNNNIPTNALFTIHFSQGYLAFKDDTGKYLTSIGNEGHVKCKKSTLEKEELWTIVGTKPQINLKGWNDKYVTTQKGMDISVNQDEITNFETFQLENDDNGKYWRFKTVADKFWGLGENNAIHCMDDRNSSSNANINKTLFEIIWLPNHQIAIKSLANQKYLTLKINKQLFAAATDISDKEKFKLFLLNRPFFVLHGSEGYVGESKNPGSPLETAKINYEETYLEQISFDAYLFKTKSGLYWSLQDDVAHPTICGVPISSNTNVKNIAGLRFYIVFTSSDRIIIKASNGKYLKIGSGKRLEASEENEEKASIWHI